MDTGKKSNDNFLDPVNGYLDKVFRHAIGLKAKEELERWNRCVDVLDSVTVYLHILSTKPDEPFLEVAASNIPFTEFGWENKLHRFGCDLLDINADMKETDDVSLYHYLLAVKQIKMIAEILTALGHEVFVCLSKNPGGKIGGYSHFSKQKAEDVAKMKEAILDIDESMLTEARSAEANP